MKQESLIKIVILVLLILGIIISFFVKKPLIDDTKGLDKIEDKILTEDNFFKELKLNDKKSATAIFGFDTSKEFDLQKDLLNCKFIEDCGKVKSYKLLVNDTCIKENDVYGLKKVCYNRTIPVNESLIAEKTKEEGFEDVYN